MTGGLQPRAPLKRAGVVAVGLRPEGPTGGGRVASIDASASAGASGGLAAALGRATEGFGYAIAIYPAWLGEEGSAPIEIARSALGTSKVAAHITYLPPLAGGVLAGLAAALSERMSVGVLLAALGRLESALRVFAWLRSVNRLPDPPPGLIHRISSILPGAAFVVSSWPEPRIWTLRRRRPTLPLPPLGEGMAVAVAAREGEAHRLVRPLEAAIAGVPVTEVAPTAGGPEWWGSASLVEAVAYPTALEPLATRLEGEISLQSCRWCGEWVAQSPCPFCGSAAEAEPRG